MLVLCDEPVFHCWPREKMPMAFFRMSRSCFTTSNSRLRRRISSRFRALMPTTRKGLGTVFYQLLTPLMDRGIGNAQLTRYLRDGFATGLSQLHCFSLQLCGRGLLHFLHDPCPPSERVYPKLSLLDRKSTRL